MVTPYYRDATVRLYLGDCREVLPALGERFDAAVADPPSQMCPICGKPSAIFKRGWCSACYQRWLKAGRPEGGPPPLENDALDRWRTLPDAVSRPAPSDLAVGTAGEHLACADLLIQGFNAFRTDQTCAYDLAVDLGGRLIRLQVKTTRSVRPIPQRDVEVLTYRWEVRRAGKGTKRMYAENAFDLLALVALDIRQVAYVPPSARGIVDIRPPGRSAAGKQFVDYPFGRALHGIGAMP